MIFWLVSDCGTMSVLTSMTEQQESTATVPADARPKTAPFWHVVLLDDDDHTYDYVIEMLGKIFGHGLETAFQMACEVDTTGRVIVDTTRLERSQGSMSASIEPAV